MAQQMSTGMRSVVYGTQERTKGDSNIHSTQAIRPDRGAHFGLRAEEEAGKTQARRMFIIIRKGEGQRFQLQSLPSIEK